MIRIAYIIWSLGLGGAEQVLIGLAAGLDRTRFEPVIICLNEPGQFAELATRQGVEVIALHKRGRVDVGMVARLIRLLRVRRIDVVHTELWGANVWGRIAARLAGVPVVIATEQNVDTWKRWYHFAIDRLLAPWTTALVGVSQETRTFYEAHGVGRGRWQVIYNAVDPSRVAPRGRGAAYRSLGIGAQDVVIGLVGRLVPAKAPEVFVQAIAQASRELPSIKALIVGDGPLRALVEHHVHLLGLDERVVFTGTRQDVPELLAGMDALVFSSEREGSSLAMLEGMAAGVPVIATAVGGTPEVIESGMSGILVPPRQPHVLADRLVELLRHPEQADAMRHAARARVEQHFSLRRMVAAHELLYENGTGSPFLDGFGKKRTGTIFPQASGPVRIAYIIDHMGRGGAQRQLIELVRRLPRDQWAPIVISLSMESHQSTLIGELQRTGVPVHPIGQHGLLDLRALWQLTQRLRQERPAIVHAWLFTATLYGSVAARLAGVRRIICAMRATLREMTPRQRWANRWLLRRASCVTVNAEVIRRELVSSGAMPDRQIRTIANGIDLSAYPSRNGRGRYRREWHVPQESPLVAMVARLNEPKDHVTFVEAAARVVQALPDVYFVLVGDGPLRGRIEARLEALGLGPRVRLVGERQDVWSLLHDVDLSVLSTLHEASSNVIMETMAAGKPIVATDVPGNRELIDDGTTGLLVPPQNPEALAAAMLRLLQHPSEAQAMGVRGRGRVAQRCSIEGMVSAHAALYRELLGRAR